MLLLIRTVANHNVVVSALRTSVSSLRLKDARFTTTALYISWRKCKVRSLYLLFNRAIQLDVVRRQQGSDEMAVPFKQALRNLREHSVTYDDWKTLSKCVHSVVPEETARFTHSLTIYFTKGHVRQHNHHHLRDLPCPVLSINAIHQGPNAHTASSDEAGNLPSQLQLSIGARVMYAKYMGRTGLG